MWFGETSAKNDVRFKPNHTIVLLLVVGLGEAEVTLSRPVNPIHSVWFGDSNGKIDDWIKPNHTVIFTGLGDR